MSRKKEKAQSCVSLSAVHFLGEAGSAEHMTFQCSDVVCEYRDIKHIFLGSTKGEK